MVNHKLSLVWDFPFYCFCLCHMVDHMVDHNSMRLAQGSPNDRDKSEQLIM